MEEAIKTLKEILDKQIFIDSTPENTTINAYEAIDTVLNELEKKDKVIDEMAGEMCYGVFKFKNVKQVKEYFYKKVE